MQLALEQPQQITLELYILDGRLIAHQDSNGEAGNNDKQFNLPSDLGSGIYFLKTYLMDKVYTNKLIKY